MKTDKIRLLASLGFALVLASASASANLIANGDFDTGSLAPWTTFTTANGTIGTPSVVSFDVTGSGASLAAEFLVGVLSYDAGAQGGGGIYQNFTSGAGALSATLDIAALGNSDFANNSAGVFSVLLDGIVQATHDFGAIAANETLRSSLSFSTTVAAGTHALSILMTRPFTTGNTPTQYIDNVVVNGPSGIPEPGILVLFGVGAGALRLGTRRAKRSSLA
jgi:hypothetical protein